MEFRAADYGADVERILALGGAGLEPMPLAVSGCTSAAARKALQQTKAAQLFPQARAPEAALAGLFLYFGCFDESHAIAQDLHTVEGSYWHGILHRQEPDAFNAAYWFRRVGKHAIFPAIRDAATRLGYKASREWEPSEFIEFCESARRAAGSHEETLAQAVQLAEWQLLFDYCAHDYRAQRITR